MTPTLRTIFARIGIPYVALFLYARATQKRKVSFRLRKASYHVVFNRPVEWSRNVHVMNWVALESGNESLQKYVRMQCIKETSTLRISRKGKKPIPKVIFRYDLQDKQIKKFLENRNFVLSFLRGG